MQILDGVIMVRKSDIDEAIRQMACHNIITGVKLARTLYKLDLITGKMFVELLLNDKTCSPGGLQLTRSVVGIRAGTSVTEFKLVEDGQTAGLDAGQINENGTLTILGILRDDPCHDVQPSFKEACINVMKMFATNGGLSDLPA